MVRGSGVYLPINIYNNKLHTTLWRVTIFTDYNISTSGECTVYDVLSKSALYFLFTPVTDYSVYLAQIALLKPVKKSIDHKLRSLFYQMMLQTPNQRFRYRSPPVAEYARTLQISFEFDSAEVWRKESL